MLRKIWKKDDHDIIEWSKELAKKTVNVNTARLRVEDFLREDMDRWQLNHMVNNLKNKAMQQYVKHREDTILNLYEENGSSSSSSTSTNSKASTKVSSLPSSYHRSGFVEEEESEEVEELGQEEESNIELDSTFNARGGVLLADETDFLFSEEEAANNYVSSTAKLFSQESFEIIEDESEKPPVELKRKVEIVTTPQKVVVQDALLIPSKGPGFKMAQIAHPDATLDPARRLPSVYFLRPLVRIFSAFPHRQQFWCRQGYPIPVPPPSQKNTFMDAKYLSLHDPKSKSFPFRVRSYKACMTSFLPHELVFIVDGRSIFVTGEKRAGNKPFRTVTEEICLPIDLDLNYLRVARTKNADIIFEELWEYDINI